MSVPSFVSVGIRTISDLEFNAGFTVKKDHVPLTFAYLYRGHIAGGHKPFPMPNIRYKLPLFLGKQGGLSIQFFSVFFSFFCLLIFENSIVRRKACAENDPPMAARSVGPRKSWECNI